MIRVQTYDFDANSTVAVKVPREPVENFLHFILNTSMWERDPLRLLREVRKLRQAVRDAHSEAKRRAQGKAAAAVVE